MDDLKLDYYIGGSVASIQYGRARMTRDVDFVVHVQAGGADKLIERLESDFHVSPVALKRSIEEGDCFNVLERSSIFQVDVFTPKPSDWMEEQFHRRQPHQVSGLERTVFLCSPEDTVLNKLLWFQMGNEASAMQWNDALGIISARSGSLDWEYLRKWAQRLHLGDLLARAERESVA
jgi:hypothetical protein